MKKNKILSLALLALTTVAAQANSFKIGPASSSDKMDFASINDAMNSESVDNGDTLWLDKNCDLTSADQYVTKKVVIIGTGYDDTQTNEGTVAKIGCLHLQADGIYVKSLNITSYVYFYNDACTVDRCRIPYVHTYSSSAGTNNVISSFILNEVYGYNSSNPSRINLYNNLFYSGNSNVINYITNSDIEYNTIINTNSSYNYIFDYVSDSKIKNNIILKTGSSSYYDNLFSDCSNIAIDHNLTSWTSAKSSYPDNKTGYGNALSSLFKCTGKPTTNYSDYYILTDNSPAKGYATDGGEVGCHGGMYGNPAGGRPQYVPYFSSVQVASKSSDGKLPISLTVKIQNQ